MASYVLERTRQLHEDIERQQDLIAEELLVAPKSVSSSLLSCSFVLPLCPPPLCTLCWSAPPFALERGLQETQEGGGALLAHRQGCLCTHSCGP